MHLVPRRAARAFLVAALLAPLLSMQATAPASATSTAPTATIVLRSGQAATGANDPIVEKSIDGSATWSPAVVSLPHGAYSVIPGTAWVSTTIDGAVTGPDGIVDYRVLFSMPAGFTDASMTVKYHADNAGTVLVNGNQVGAQPQDNTMGNFQDPAETVDTAVAAGSLIEGANELRIQVRDFGLPTGLDFEATVTYTPDQSWSCDGVTLPTRDAASTFSALWYDRLSSIGDPMVEGFDFDAFYGDAHQAILEADGFAGLTVEQMRCLIVSLDAHLAENLAGYGLAGSDEARSLLYALIFDHAWLDDARQTSGVEIEAPALPELPLDRLLSEIDGLRNLAAQTAAPVTLPAGLAPGAPNVVTIPDLPPAPKLPDSVLGIVNLALATTRQAVDSTTYQVCSTSPTKPAPTCSPDIALGSPWAADVDGDLVPDTVARLAPQVALGASLTSLTATFTADRLTPATGALPGHVWAVFELPTSPVRMNVGFVGVESTLADHSEVKLEIPDIVATAQGNPSATLTLNHTKPGTAAGVSFAFAKLDQTQLSPKPLEPITGAVTFYPLPASGVKVTATVDRDIDNAGDVGDDRYDLRLNLPTPTKVRAAIASNPKAYTGAPRPSREIVTTIDRVPSQVDVRIDDNAPAGLLDATYTATSSINEVTIASTERPDETKPTTYSRFGATLKKVPASINAKIYQASNADVSLSKITYSASSGLERIDASAEKVIAGVVATQAKANVAPVPSFVEVEAYAGPTRTDALTHLPPPAKNTTVTYKASAPIAVASAQMYDNLRGSSVKATLTGVPKEWTLHSYAPVAEAARKHVEFASDSRVQQLDLAMENVVERLGTVKMNGTIKGIPSFWKLGYGNNQATTFDAGLPGAPEVIDAINLDVTNHDTVDAGSKTAAHLHAAMIERDDDPATATVEFDQIEASLAIGGVQAVSLATDATTGLADVTLKTAAAVLPSIDMTTFRVKADVTSLDATTRAPARIRVDGTLSGTAPGRALPPTLQVIKEGASKAKITIIQDSATPIAARAAIAVGTPVAVDAAWALPLGYVSGVSLRDVEGGCAADGCDGSRINLYLPQLPKSVAIDTGSITRDLSEGGTGGTTPGFVARGLTLPAGGLDVDLGLDDGDDPAGDLAGVIKVGGKLNDARLSLYPIEMQSFGDPYVGIRYEADQVAGPLVVDLRMGAPGMPTPDSRLVATVASLPKSLVFKAGLPKGSGSTYFNGWFGTSPGGVDSPLPAIDVAMHSPASGGAQLALQLREVPGQVQVEIYKAPVAVSTDQCKQPPSALPRLSYVANDDTLDLKGYIQPDATQRTALALDLQDMGRDTRFSSNPAGTFTVESNPPSTKLGVHVTSLELTAVEISFDNCHAEILDFQGGFSLGLKTNVSIEIFGAPRDKAAASKVEVVPGLVTGVNVLSGIARVELGLSDASANLRMRDFGLKLNLTVRGIRINPTLFGPVNKASLGIPLGVNFHIAQHTPGPLFSIATGIACPVPPLQLNVDVNVSPHKTGEAWHLARLDTNATTYSGKWSVMADPHVNVAGYMQKLLPTVALVDTADVLMMLAGPYGIQPELPGLACR